MRIALKWKSIGFLMALILAASCGRQQQLAPIGLIVVRSADLAPALEEAGLDGRALAGAAREGLSSAGLIVDEGTRRSYRATIDVVAVGVSPSGGPSTAEVIIDLQVEPRWAAGPAVKRSGRASAPLSSANRVGAWRAAFKGAIQEAGRQVALDLGAQRKGTETLLVDLSDADPGVRERALRTLASRGAKGAAKAVARLVHDPDPDVARAAIDALVAFRDPGSALSLIEAAQAGDTATVLRIIPVLEEMGGPDVEGYLLTLESGHGDRAVRQAAGEALAKPRSPEAPGPRRPSKPSRTSRPSQTD